MNASGTTIPGTICFDLSYLKGLLFFVYTTVLLYFFVLSRIKLVSPIIITPFFSSLWSTPNFFSLLPLYFSVGAKSV
jgi:hypothetical protein